VNARPLVKKFQNLSKRVEAIRPFTQSEAWGLFRLAAFAEAIGWALLIAGILIRNQHGFGSGVAVPIAGRIHGMCFITYFAVVILVSTSLRWPWRSVLLAILAGVPPFGSIVFEQAMARWHKNHLSRQHYRSVVLTALVARL
jgi:integral membrane protein